MLFNSYQFIAFFLPLALAGYYCTADNRVLRLSWLLLTSLFFYGYWDWRFLPLLMASISVNWLLSLRIGATSTRLLVVIGVAFNLLLTAIFKYLDFLGQSLAYLQGVEYSAVGLILPLGISFSPSSSYRICWTRADSRLRVIRFWSTRCMSASFHN